MLTTSKPAFIGVLLGVLCSLQEEASSQQRQFPLIPFQVQKQRRRLASNEQSRQRRRALKVDGDDDGALLRRSQQQVNPAYQGYGTHYVDFWVGTPPQRQTVIIDTGGDGSTAIPCSMCKNCGSNHTDTNFNETASTTFQVVPCDSCTNHGRCGDPDSAEAYCKTSFGYECNSWRGFEVQDIVYLGGPHEKALVGKHPSELRDDVDPTQANDFRFLSTFSCQTSVGSLFRNQMADGILDMGNTASSYWQQARGAGLTDASSSFSLCFARQQTPSRNGTEAGAMTMGGYDARLHNENSPVVYAKMTNATVNGRARGFFYVTVKGIYLRNGGGGDSALPLDKRPVPILPVNMSETLDAMVDSGTTDTYLSRALSTPIKERWEDLSGGIPFAHKGERVFTEEELNALPTVLFHLQGDVESNRELLRKDDASAAGASFPLGSLGSAVPDPSRTEDEGLDVVVAMPPSHYMEYDDKMGYYINRLYVDEGGSRTAVFGANWLMGHDVTFDPDKARIGFAESDCDYHGLLKKSHEPTEDYRTSYSSSISSDPTHVIGMNEAQQQRQQSTNRATKSSRQKVFGFLAGMIGLIVVPTVLYGKRWADLRYGMNIRYEITSVMGPEL